MLLMLKIPTLSHHVTRLPLLHNDSNNSLRWQLHIHNSDVSAIQYAYRRTLRLVHASAHSDLSLKIRKEKEARRVHQNRK